MRYLVLMVVGMTLLTVGLFFPWGDKQVTRHDCRTVFLADQVRVSERCDVQQVDALYWADHLTIDVRTWQTVDGSPEGQPVWEREFHDYALTGERWDGNGALFWGRPVLWFSVGLAALAVVGVLVTQRRKDVVRQTALWGLVAAVIAVMLGTLLGLGGMVIHSATWKGTFVAPLAARPGGVMVAAGAGLAVFGALRHHRAGMLQLEGVGSSPLAPIGSWEAPVEAPDARSVLPRLAAPAWAALLAVALVAPLLFVPFAHKDITLPVCEPDPQRGWVCHERHLAVRYGLRAATITSYEQGAVHEERLSYEVAFQEQYGGSRWMWTATWTALAGVAALAWLATRQVQERVTQRRAWLATVVYSLAIIAAATPIIAQSWNWPGSPAGHLRPGLGAYLASLAVVPAVVSVWMLRRRPGDDRA